METAASSVRDECRPEAGRRGKRGRKVRNGPLGAVNDVWTRVRDEGWSDSDQFRYQKLDQG